MTSYLPRPKRERIRTIVLGSSSWQVVDEPGTRYRFILRGTPVFENGKQVFLADGITPKMKPVFVPQKLPRIELYE